MEYELVGGVEKKTILSTFIILQQSSSSFVMNRLSVNKVQFEVIKTSTIYSTKWYENYIDSVDI